MKDPDTEAHQEADQQPQNSVQCDAEIQVTQEKKNAETQASPSKKNAWVQTSIRMKTIILVSMYPVPAWNYGI